jgi:tRNA-dihydrouridine synthase A
LSPKENRTVPPLRYEDVYRLKREHPHLEIEINGGIRGLDEAARHLQQVDAVMIGRAAWDDPYLFATVDQRFFGAAEPPPSRREVVESFLPYVERHQGQGVSTARLLFPMQGLFAGQSGTRAFRRALSEHAHRTEDAGSLLREALARVPAAVLEDRPETVLAGTRTSQVLETMPEAG